MSVFSIELRNEEWHSCLDYVGWDFSEENAEHKFELLTLDFLYSKWREKGTSVRASKTKHARRDEV